MKFSFFTVALLLGSSAHAIDRASMEQAARERPLYHKSCDILVAEPKDEAMKPVHERFVKLLQEKGYTPKEHTKAFKPHKTGLFGSLASKEKKEERLLDHKIKACEKAKQHMILEFDSGWKNNQTGFNTVKIVGIKDVNCSAIKGTLIEADREVLRSETAQYSLSQKRPDYTNEQFISAAHHDTMLAAVVALPKCEKRDNLVFVDPNTSTNLQAPPPVAGEAGTYNGERYNNAKDLNEIEARRTRPSHSRQHSWGSQR